MTPEELDKRAEEYASKYYSKSSKQDAEAYSQYEHWCETKNDYRAGMKAILESNEYIKMKEKAKMYDQYV